MKTEDLILLAAGGLLLMTMFKPQGTASVAPGQRPVTTTKPNNWLGGLFVAARDLVAPLPRQNGVIQTGGWLYDTSGTGTVVSPTGDYYNDGHLVYSPATYEMGPVDPTAHAGYYDPSVNVIAGVWQ